MPDRKMSNEEKSKPCVNIIVWYPIKFNLSMEKGKYRKLKESLKDEGRTVNDFGNRDFLLKLFNVGNWQEWKSKNPFISKKLDRDIKERIFTEMLGLDTNSLSNLFRHTTDDYLENKKKKDEEKNSKKKNKNKSKKKVTKKNEEDLMDVDEIY